MACPRCAIRATRSITTRHAFTRTLRRAPARRWQSTEAVAAVNPKIDGIVDSIGKLTLLETADLIKTLKVASDRVTT